MKINIKSLTPATLVINSLGNYNVPGGANALGINISEAYIS